MTSQLTNLQKETIDNIAASGPVCVPLSGGRLATFEALEGRGFVRQIADATLKNFRKYDLTDTGRALATHTPDPEPLNDPRPGVDDLPISGQMEDAQLSQPAFTIIRLGFLPSPVFTSDNPHTIADWLNITGSCDDYAVDGSSMARVVNAECWLATYNGLKRYLNTSDADHTADLIFNGDPALIEDIAPIDAGAMWADRLAAGPRLVVFRCPLGSYAGVAISVAWSGLIRLKYYHPPSDYWYAKYAEPMQVALLPGLTSAQESEAILHLLAGERLPKALGIVVVGAVAEMGMGVQS